MAVFKRNYKPYEGRTTPAWARFFVLTRYSLETLFQSRLLIVFLMACYATLIPFWCIIYLHHNLDALAVFKISTSNLLPINSDFFIVIQSFQGVMAFLLTAYAGPTLVSPDLTNNALPLYLCRPISRVEYVLGRMSVLFVLLSMVTWVPTLALFLMEANYSGGTWFWDNGYIAAAVFLGSWVWIIFLALMALAVSAWVKWRLAASAIMGGLFFVSSGFAEAINEIMRTQWGYAISLGHVIGVVWMKLFRTDARESIWANLFNVREGHELPLWAAWLMLLALSGFFVMLLDKRLKGREVVR